MPLQSSGQLTARDIANEFGYSRGSTGGIRIGDYRGQGFTNPNNTTVRIPTSENVTNDPNGSVRFSDFYGGRLTLVVNYFSQAAELKPGDAYTRFDGQVQKTVVSGFKIFSSDNTAGKRVVILVNEDIGSDKTANNSCALRTGTGWNSDTVMQVLLGPDGEILGAGGDGGNQRPGSSGLGVQFEGVGGTSVVIQNGGRIAGGGGGGGNGGSAYAEERTWGNGRQCAAGRGGGGGGAGLPAGVGQPGGGSGGASSTNGTAGGNGNSTTGGAGGVGGYAQTNRGAYCSGGNGGNGGNLASSGTTGGNGTLGGDYERGESGTSNGLGGGVAGAAIRRTVTTVIITNEGPPSQLVGDTSAAGIT